MVRGRARNVVALIFMSGIGAASARATDFYVTTNGTTSTAIGTGSSSSPWAL